MEEGQISSLIDRSSLEAEKKYLLGLLDEFEDKIQALSKIKISLSGATGAKPLKAETEKLNEAQKELLNIQGQVEKQSAKLAALHSQEAKRLAELKVQQLDLNKANKDAARDALGLTNAYDKQSKTLIELRKAYKALAAEGKQNTKEAQALKKEVQDLDKKLKNIDASVGQFQRNVGNYTGAVSILKKAFEDTGNKIDELTNQGKANDAEMQKLTKEYQILSNLVESSAAGYASATAELKANEKALQQLGAAGLQQTDFYQQLLRETAELKDNVGDLKNEIKNLASDTRALDGLVGSAQMLAGTYAVATESAKVFGVESEELNEAMQKSQAIIAVLSGLQAIQNALQRDSATMLFLQDLRTKGLILTQRLYAAVMAQGTIATKAFRAALITTGLGAILVLLTSFSTKMEAYAESVSEATEKQRKLRDALKDTNEALVEQNSELVRFQDETRKGLEKNIQLAEASGASQEKLFALKRKLAEYDKQAAKEQLDNLELSMVGVDRLALRYDGLLRAQLGYQRLQQQEAGKGNDRGVEQAKKLAEEVKKEIDSIKPLLDAGRQALDQYYTSTDELQTQAIERSRFNSEQERKLAYEIGKLKIEDAIDINQKILDSEASDFGERQQALKRQFDKQKALVDLTRKYDLSSTELTGQERKIINAKANADLIKLEREYQKQKSEEGLKWIERERAARLSIDQATITTRASAYQKIAEDENRNIVERLAAQVDYSNAQIALIELQKNHELQAINLTATERQAIEANANTAIADQRMQLMERLKEIGLAELDQQTSIRIAGNTKEQQEALAALNAKFEAGKIGLKEYNAERLKLERGYLIESLQINIEQIQKIINARKKLGLDVSQQEAELASLELSLSDLVTNQKIDNLQKLRDKQKELGQEVMNLATSLVTAEYDRQKNAIQEQIDLLDEKKEKEIEAVNASMASEQEKANKIAIINARAAAQKEQLERRQRQLDIERAKFEKVARVASIIMNTAQGVSAALAMYPPNIPLAVTVGAIGAIQVATALAQPIPKFKDGTQDAPGGYSIVGDGGKQEVIVEPGGKAYMTPAKDTLVNIPAHSKVFPSVDAYNKAMMNAAMRQLPVMDGSAISEKWLAEEMSRAFEKEAGKIVSAIINKPEHGTRLKSGELRDVVKIGNHYTEYINKNIFN